MPTDATEPRRLVNADVIRMQHELAMKQAERSPGEPSVSVELDDTAKGDTSPTVKIYAPLGCDLEALALHAAKVREIAVSEHKAARDDFPRANGAT